MNKVSANSPTSGNERLVLLARADACSCTRVCERVRLGSLGEPVAAETGAFFIALFRRSCWPRLSAASSCRAVAAAFAGGWTPDRLTVFAGFSTAGIKYPSPCSRLGSRPPGSRLLRPRRTVRACPRANAMRTLYREIRKPISKELRPAAGHESLVGPGETVGEALSRAPTGCTVKPRKNDVLTPTFANREGRIARTGTVS
jgi:hypothetical protein